MAVRFVERVGELASKFENLFEGERTFFEALRKRLAFEALHDEIVGAVLMADVIENTDVRMIQAGNCPCFALEALLVDGVIRNLRRENFDRDGAVEARIARAKDFAHAARTQRGDNFIRTELVSCGEAHDWRKL